MLEPPRTHYETLGVPEDAAFRQIQAAFFLLSKRWHPDRVGPEAADVLASATRVFDGIASAYRVLADPAARAAYDEELQAASSATVSVDRALGGELAFQKAEAFLARGNLEAAEREARLALEYEPERAEHIALVAWLDALKPDYDERRIGAIFAHALELSQTGVKVHWYRGLFLKRSGRHASALQEFRYVCERDARHIDAAREVRIYEQRLQKSPKDQPSLAPESPVSERSPWTRLFKRRS
jgi:curved DNA-binding protein CbpA